MLLEETSQCHLSQRRWHMMTILIAVDDRETDVEFSGQFSLGQTQLQTRILQCLCKSHLTSSSEAIIAHVTVSTKIEMCFVVSGAGIALPLR